MVKQGMGSKPVGEILFWSGQKAREWKAMAKLRNKQKKKKKKMGWKKK